MVGPLEATGHRPDGFVAGISEREMDWESEALYNKAKLYAMRAHNEPIDSSLFAFWMSLALELLARAALSSIHPALLADPREPDNLHYAFGIFPKRIPLSIPSKALYARCSVFIPSFTDKMSAHCLIVADRRNAELHSGAAAFEGLNNASWLPATYEVSEVLLNHLKRNFTDFLGDHAAVAVEALKDRRENLVRDVQQRLAEARRKYEALSTDERTALASTANQKIALWLKGTLLRRTSECPACGNSAVIGGEALGRSPVRIDPEENRMSREVRVLPNKLHCPYCEIVLNSFQEVREAGRGDLFTVEEREDPIEFFGIDPEEYVDVEELIKRYGEDMYAEYQNE